MWIYYGNDEAIAIVGDEYVYSYTADPDLIVVGDPDLHVYARIAVFQPIGSYQLPLFGRELL